MHHFYYFTYSGKLNVAESNILARGLVLSLIVSKNTVSASILFKKGTKLTSLYLLHMYL